MGIKAFYQGLPGKRLIMHLFSAMNTFTFEFHDLTKREMDVQLIIGVLIATVHAWAEAGKPPYLDRQV